MGRCSSAVYGGAPIIYRKHGDGTHYLIPRSAPLPSQLYFILFVVFVFLPELGYFVNIFRARHLLVFSHLLFSGQWTINSMFYIFYQCLLGSGEGVLARMLLGLLLPRPCVGSISRCLFVILYHCSFYLR